MSRFKDYDDSIFEESCKKKSKVEFEDECGDRPVSKSVDFNTESSKPKKRVNRKMDDEIDFEGESCRHCSSKKGKSASVDFEEECGNGNCGNAKWSGPGFNRTTFRNEAADTSTNVDTTSTDTNMDNMSDSDMGSDDSVDVNMESAKPKKKIKKGTDTEFTDEDMEEDEEDTKPKSKKRKDDDDIGEEECDDDETCEEPTPKKKKAKQDTDVDEEEEKPKKKKSSKKKKKKSAGDLDLDNLDEEDSDDEDDEEEEPDVGDEEVDFDEESFFGFGRKKKEPEEDPELTKLRQQQEEARKRIMDAKNKSGKEQADAYRQVNKNLGAKNRIGAYGEASSYDHMNSDEHEHDDRHITEFMIDNYIDQIHENQLRMEREIMTSLIDDLYKEYSMLECIDDESFFEESYEEDADEESEDEFVQERFFGGTGKSVAKTVKPVAKVAKKVTDYKHGVGRKGIIRNVVHRTKKDLKKGGILYKLVTWPFLIIKNLAQTIYHKTKSFFMYRGILSGIEVKVNREISKIRKNAQNLPKVAMASGIGYGVTAITKVAKGEKISINPAEFITTEGAKLVEELGRDTMIRAITSKMADAIEDSPDKIREVIKRKDTSITVTHDAGQAAKPVITINQNAVTMERVVNVQGVNAMLDDIDKWASITEQVAANVRAGDFASISQLLSQMKELENKYIPNGKINNETIFSSKSSAVKVADFYGEISSRLQEKSKQIEKGLEKITGLEVSIKDGNVSVSPEVQKSLTELNASIQHTCNAFLELIDALDDLGKYVTTSMNSYLGCLEKTNDCMEQMLKNKGGKAPAPNLNEKEPKPEKKHKHKLFGKKELEDEG